MAIGDTRANMFAQRRGRSLIVSRYRPPQPKRSPYITRDGYEHLLAESRATWKRRRVVTEALAAAAAEGDRSENAEYIYRKKELREIDRRIRYLEIRLPGLKVVDNLPEDTSRVFFGAWVDLEDDNGNETSYRIVGSDELDPARTWISVDAPLTRALIGKSLDDQVLHRAPCGTLSCSITAIRYETKEDA